MYGREILPEGGSELTCGIFPVAIEEFWVRTAVLRCPSREFLGQHVMLTQA